MALTFKTNLVPGVDKTYSLGSSTQTWVIYGRLIGTANYAIHAGQANSATSNGYVIASSGYANKVWKTNANGEPGWRDDENTIYDNLNAVNGGTALSLVTTGEKYIWNSKTNNTGTVTSITAGIGLTTTAEGTTDGGTISTSGTIHLTKLHTNSTTYGPTANITGSNNTTITIPQIAIDAYGRVTGITERTYTSRDTTYTFTGGNAGLSWGTTVTLATVGGVAINAALPAYPNTDTLNTTGATNSTSKLYAIGTTSASSNNVTYSSSLIYMQNGTLTATTFSGALNGTATNAKLSGTASFAINAGTASFAISARQVNNSLTIGPKIFNGSTAVNIAIADLGLSTAISFLGVTLTKPTTASISLIDGTSKTAVDGSVVLAKDNGMEYIYSNGVWEDLGLATSFALANHIHGNINNNGTISLDTAIAPNFQIVGTDTTGTILKLPIKFDGSTTTQALTKKGTWEVFNNYVLPNATSSILGGVKIGSNISVSNGTISLTKSNITTALGYTPPEINTTYTFANGTTGNFVVTPSNGTALTISIGKPTTAGTADKATAANLATTANTIVKYADTAGTFANSGVTIDSNNNVTTSATSYIKAGTIQIGGPSSGGTTSPYPANTINSTYTLYLNRPTANSIVFKHNGVNKIRIDTDNALRPEVDVTNTLTLGTTSATWKNIYVGTGAGAQNQGISFANNDGTVKAKIGANDSGGIGIYTSDSQQIFLRTSLTDTSSGLTVKDTEVEFQTKNLKFTKDSKSASIVFNSTTNALDFVFA